MSSIGIPQSWLLLCRRIHICAKTHLQPLFALIHSVPYNAVTPKLMRFFWWWSCHFISIYVLILKIITNYDQMDLSNKLKFYWKIAGTECTVSVFWEEESLHERHCHVLGVTIPRLFTKLLSTSLSDIWNWDIYYPTRFLFSALLPKQFAPLPIAPQTNAIRDISYLRQELSGTKATPCKI